MTDTSSFHMSSEDFRRHGHELVEWLADYMDSVGSRQVVPDVKPGDISRLIPSSPPDAPEPFVDLIRDLDDVVMPGITHWQSPGWFAYYPASTSGPSILAELVSAGLGVQGMLWSTSPAVTEVESRVTDWLVELLDLPETWRNDQGPGGGVLQSSASDSTHLVHVVARIQADGSAGGRRQYVSYASQQAHSSVEKAARVAGVEHYRAVEVDAEFSMRPAALSAAISADRAAGLTPLIVTSAIGTTGTAAVDPVAAVAEIAADEDLWHHVDAAYGGAAMALPGQRHLQAGIGAVDSYTFNPHKWMFTNFDCNVLYVADRGGLIDAMSITPPYLRNAASDSGEVIDYRDWQVPLGRRFRALKLWWVLRSYGVQGIRHHLQDHIDLARAFGELVEAHELLELVAPVTFGLVCFRHRDGNDATGAVLDAVNAVPTQFVTGSSIGDDRFIRVSVGSTWTSGQHVRKLWDAIDAAAREQHGGTVR